MVRQFKKCPECTKEVKELPKHLRTAHAWSVEQIAQHKLEVRRCAVIPTVSYASITNQFQPQTLYSLENVGQILTQLGIKMLDDIPETHKDVDPLTNTGQHREEQTVLAAYCRAGY